MTTIIPEYSKGGCNIEVMDDRSTEELFRAAMAEDYDDAGEFDVVPAWEAVQALRRRATPEVFAMACHYAASDDARERQRGLDVLAHLSKFEADAVPVAMQHLGDSNHKVANSAAWALCHLNGPEARAALVTLRKHPYRDVRHAVATALGHGECPGRVETLLELIEDPEEVVRDWATWALGRMPESPFEDTPQIREALRKRLSDSYKDVRYEALWGLALRKDPDALLKLAAKIESGYYAQGDEDAALEVLQALRRKVSPEELCLGLRALAGAATNHTDSPPHPTTPAESASE